MTLPANALFNRRWKLNVFRSSTRVTLNPLTTPEPEDVILPSVPSGTDTSGDTVLPDVIVTAKAIPRTATVTSLTQNTDLSLLRMTFDITAADVETPNLAIIRVYNVAPQTEKLLTAKNIDQSEFAQVDLQVGYGDGPLASIFTGTIKQCYQGRENPTDTFVLIHAGDGDDFYNFAQVSGTLASGANSDQDVLNYIRNNASSQDNIQWGSIPGTGTAGGVLPRGKVLWGLARTYLKTAAINLGHAWSVQRGELTFIPTDGALPGEAVEINSLNGMLGLPIQTNQGMIIKTLILPQIRVGGLIHLNNRSIQQALFSLSRANFANPLLDPNNLLAHLDDDGFYRVFAIDYKGDSRGDMWEQVLTCLAVDTSTDRIKEGG